MPVGKLHCFRIVGCDGRLFADAGDLDLFPGADMFPFGLFLFFDDLVFAVCINQSVESLKSSRGRDRKGA